MPQSSCHPSLTRPNAACQSQNLSIFQEIVEYVWADAVKVAVSALSARTQLDRGPIFPCQPVDEFSENDSVNLAVHDRGVVRKSVKCAGSALVCAVS